MEFRKNDIDDVICKVEIETQYREQMCEYQGWGGGVGEIGDWGWYIHYWYYT